MCMLKQVLILDKNKLKMFLNDSFIYPAKY